MSITIALRGLAIAVGVVFLSFFFAYESQQGRLQSKLEDLWIRIDDLKKTALSWHLSFMRVIAGALTSFGDRLFGRKVISLQSIGVSMCFAFVIWSIADIIFRAREPYYNPLKDGEDLHDVIVYTFLGFVPYMIGKVSPDLCVHGALDYVRITCPYINPLNFTGKGIRRLIEVMREAGVKCLCASSWIKAWFLILTILFYRNYICPCTHVIEGVPPILSLIFMGLSVLVLTSAVVGTIFFIAFVIATRIAVKRVATSTSAIKSGMWLLLGCLPILVYYLLLRFWLASLDYVDLTTSSNAHASFRDWLIILTFIIIVISAFINAAFIFATVIFLLLAVILILHRITWPVVEKMMYKLQQMHFGGRAKLFGFLGIYFLLAGFGKTDLLEKIWKLAGRLFFP